MISIDISAINSRRIRTLLHFLNDIYKCELQPDDNMIDEFIAAYIPEEKDFIFQHTKGKYRELNNLQFVSDRENIRKCDSFNSGIYNVCSILVSIDRDYNKNFEIIDSIELEEYEEAAKLLNDKIENLITVQLGVSNYVIEHNQERGKFDFAKHYNVAPDIHIYIVKQRNLQWMKRMQNKLQGHDLFFSDILLFWELSIVRRKCDILKLMLALICICKSYEYDNDMNKCAEIFIDLFQEIMFCGEIHKIYVQQKAMDEDIPANKRGSEHATTRFSIIFSAENEDIFVLRVDLPHKSEMKLHLNMHECVDGQMLPTGYPLENSKKNISMLKTWAEGEGKELFYELNNHIWFRSNFEDKLRVLEISEGSKNNLSELFRDRCHYSVDLDIESEKEFIGFTNELKDYIANFSLQSNVFLSFDRDTLDYGNEIKNIRMQQRCLKELSNAVVEYCNASIEGDKSLWKIFSRMGLEEKIGKGEFIEMDFSKCWEWIDKCVL